MEKEKLTSNKYYSIAQATDSESKKTLWIITGIIAFGIAVIYTSAFEFFFSLLGIKSSNGCPLLTFAAVPCPFCGLGRVFSCITDLYIARTFYYNPFGLLFYLLLGAYFAITIYLAIKKKKIVYTAKGNKLIWLPVIFIAIMWIMNILFGHHG